jgi:glucose/arabinose dehydrogenase
MRSPHGRRSNAAPSNPYAIPDMIEPLPSSRPGWTVATLAAAVLLLAPAPAQSGSGLTLPGGYDSVVYASGLPSPPTALALDAQNRVFMATIDGQIRRLIDANQDGIAEAFTTFYGNPTWQLSSVTDILWIGTKLYVCHMGVITTLEDTNADDVADVVTDIVTNIPTGFHQNNGLLFDPPNHLLITNGSATDLGPETNPMNAAVLRCELSGANLAIHATGIRNCYRMARHPVTGDVFGGENEWNLHPTETLKGDEINVIVAGGAYGYPAHFGIPPTGAGTVPPMIILPQHTAPTGVVFNPNTAISGYRNEMFMTLFTQGSSATIVRVPVWYGVISGLPAGLAELFAGGFVNPIDVEFLPNGSLLVADFSAMTIHRIFPKTDAMVIIETPPSIGTAVPIRLRSPSHPGAIVYMGASLAPTPPVVLGANLVVYLDISSPVFALSVTPGNGYFNFPIPGNLDAAGEHLASLLVPNDPALQGIEVWLSYVVVDGAFTPLATSPEQKVTILPQW